MNKNIISIGVIALLVVVLIGNVGLFSNDTLAETDANLNIVTVNGAGSISVKPDIAYITIGVETEDADAGLAQNENKMIMSAVMKALLSNVSNEDDIKTTNYSIYDRYNYKDNGEREKYYLVSNSVEVTIRDIEIVGQIIDVAAKAGANQISSIRFGISNENEVYNEALKLAMESAKDKAKSIMSTFGKEVGAPYKVTETNSYSGVIRAEYSMAMDEKSISTPVSSGELTVTANVLVEYNY